MTTSRSPLSTLKTQADKIASILKGAERGDPIPATYAQKIAQARLKESFKTGIVMDDKIITFEIPWLRVRETSERALAEWILQQMRGRGNDA